MKSFLRDGGGTETGGSGRLSPLSLFCLFFPLQTGINTARPWENFSDEKSLKWIQTFYTTK